MRIQVVVETARIEDVYFFVVDAELVPGHHLKQLVERAHASGQDDGGRDAV